ncbi:MAG: zf-HC2 domain-containing protein [Burkholderiales bacterium]|nr:zf-HC2 domain-containing protein [Burkholderiales bacterium]
MSCKDATRLMSQSLDTELSLPKRFALRLHLAICTSCRHFRAQMSFIRHACRHFSGRDDEARGEQQRDGI